MNKDDAMKNEKQPISSAHVKGSLGSSQGGFQFKAWVISINEFVSQRKVRQTAIPIVFN